MLKEIIAICVAALLSFPSASGCSLRPERFGAVGDGVNDDAPAFNKCLSLGVPIKLTKGKTYLLNSYLEPITSERFELRGGGASLVVGDSYPLSGMDRILRFHNGDHTREAFLLSDLNVHYLQGCKSTPRQQDAYFICIDNCAEVKLNNIRFDSPGQKNKLAFLVCFGSASLEMKNCDISVLSPGCEGGVLWFMNRFMPRSTVNLEKCRFVQDTIDETICFSALELVDINACRIEANVVECDFISPCEGRSSGFLMAYNHFPSPAGIHVSFRDCSFTAKGRYPRRIMSYQMGEDPDFRYARIHSEFDNCRFDFDSEILSDEGMLSLPFLANRPWDDCLYSFSGCKFKIKGTHPLIGDRDGNKAGAYEFSDCEVEIEGNEPFTKTYNVPTSKIYISVNGKKLTKRK